MSENQSRGASALYLSLQWALPLLIVFVQFTVVSNSRRQQNSGQRFNMQTVGLSVVSAAMAGRAWGSDGLVSDDSSGWGATLT